MLREKVLSEIVAKKFDGHFSATKDAIGQLDPTDLRSRAYIGQIVLSSVGDKIRRYQLSDVLQESEALAALFPKHMILQDSWSKRRIDFYKAKILRFQGQFEETRALFDILTRVIRLQDVLTSRISSRRASIYCEQGHTKDAIDQSALAMNNMRLAD